MSPHRAGLRREEVALLAGISVDYVVRLEQARGPQPSTQVLGALARALRLSTDERDHVFHLAGAATPQPGTIDLNVRLVLDPDAATRQTVANLRAAAGRYPTDPGLRRLLDDLQRGSVEFRELWAATDATRWRSRTKTLVRPSLGELVLECDSLHVPDADQVVMVYSAAPGTEAAEKLALLRVLGTQAMTPASVAGDGDGARSPSSATSPKNPT